MSVLQGVNIVGNERIDLPDFSNIENFARTDWQEFFKNFFSNTPQIIGGFDITDPWQYIGTSTFTIPINIANSAMFHPTSTNIIAGFFVGSSTEAAENITITPDTVNYVEMDVTRITSAADLRAFWDDSENGGEGKEFSQIIDTIILLKVEVSANTNGFSAGKIPIAIIESEGGVVTSIQDARPLFHRLGSGGLNPDPFHNFDFPDDPTGFARIDSPTIVDASNKSQQINPFKGSDKNIRNLKDDLDAIKTRIKEIAGSAFWFSNGGLTSGINLSNLWWDTVGSKITGVGNWQHDSGGSLQWTSDIFIKSITGKLFFTVPVTESPQTIADGSVMYISLVRHQPFSSGANVIWTNGSNIVSGAQGSFINLKTGTDPEGFPFIKKSIDGIENYVRVSRYLESDLSTTELNPALAFGAELATNYQGISETTTGVFSNVNYTVTVDTKENVPNDGDTYWIAYRDDNAGIPRIYMRGHEGELEEGEIREISDTDEDLKPHMIDSTVKYKWIIPGAPRSTGTLTWDDDVVFQIAGNGFNNTMTVNPSTGIDIEVGEVAYVILDRNSAATVAPVVAASTATVLKSDKAFIFARRDGDDILIGANSTRLQKDDVSLSDFSDHLGKERLLKVITNPAGASNSIFIYPSQRISGDKRRYTFVGNPTGASSKFPLNTVGDYDGGANDDRLTEVQANVSGSDVNIDVVYPDNAPENGTIGIVLAPANPSWTPVLIGIDPLTDLLITKIGATNAGAFPGTIDDDLFPIEAFNLLLPLAVIVVEVTGAGPTIANIDETRLVDRRSSGGGAGGESIQFQEWTNADLVATTVTIGSAGDPVVYLSSDIATRQGGSPADLTLSHDLSSGTNRKILVNVANSGAGVTLSGVTFDPGGANQTVLTQVSTFPKVGSGNATDAWYADLSDSVPGGTYNVTVSFNTADHPRVEVISFANTKAGSPSQVTTATGTSSSPSLGAVNVSIDVATNLENRGVYIDTASSGPSANGLFSGNGTDFPKKGFVGVVTAEQNNRTFASSYKSVGRIQYEDANGLITTRSNLNTGPFPSFTVGSTDANTRLVVMIAMSGGSLETVTGITWNAGTENFTQATGAPFTDGNNHVIDIWYLDNPTATTDNIVTTLTDGKSGRLIAGTFHNVNTASGLTFTSVPSTSTVNIDGVDTLTFSATGLTNNDVVASIAMILKGSGTQFHNFDAPSNGPFALGPINANMGISSNWDGSRDATGGSYLRSENAPVDSFTYRFSDPGFCIGGWIVMSPIADTATHSFTPSYNLQGSEDWLMTGYLVERNTTGAPSTSGNQFTVVGDKTLEFHSGRRVRVNNDTDGFKYSWVLSSAYNGGTNETTVTLTSDAVTSNLLTADFGILSSNPLDPDAHSLPQRAQIVDEKGETFGYASLDATARLPESQLTTGTKAYQNHVLVKSKDDFPAPIAGVITLDNNVLYEINGTISLGTDRIEMGISNTLRGNDRSDDVITYTGVGNLLTLTDNDATIQGLGFSSPSGTALNLTSTTGTNLVEVKECFFTGCNKTATIDDFFFCIIRNNFFDNNTDGISFAGTLGSHVAIVDNVFTDTNTGTFIDLGTATFDSFIIDRNNIDVPSGSTGIDGAASSANINAGGQGVITSNAFQNTGTFIATILNTDLLWIILNNGFGVANSTPIGSVLLENNATLTNIVTINVWELVADGGSSVAGPGINRFQRNNLTVGTNTGFELEYIGLRTDTFTINLSLSAIKAGGGTEDFQFTIFKNGTKLSNVTVTRNFGVSAGLVSLTAPVSLTTNDTIDVRVRSIGGTADITIRDLQIVVK